MRVAVTGATGHIGSVLVRRLVEEGHRVRAVVHGDASVLDGVDVERVGGDMRDPASLRAAFDGQEVLFHLAAVISVQRGDEALVRAVNVDGVKNAAEAALHAGVRRMVHISSVHAYDTWRLPGPLREDGARAGDGHPCYDRSKADGEVALRSVIARGLNATILNPVGVVGPWDHRPSLMGRTVMQMYRGTLRMVPEGGFCWVDVRDVVEAALSAVERGEIGANHLLSGGPMTLHAIQQHAREKSGGNRWSVVLPRAALRRIPWIIDGLGLSRFAPATLTADSLLPLGSELTVDTSRARDALGFAARPVTDALADAIDWWRERGHLA